MEEKVFKYYEIVEKMKNEMKRSNRYFYIFTLFIPVVIWAVFNVENSMGIVYVYGAFYLFELCTYIYRNATFNNKLQELERYQGEIDKYCVEMRSGIYATEYSLMILSGGASKNKIIKLEDIESIDSYTQSDGPGNIRIKLKDGEFIDIPYNNKIVEFLRRKEPPKCKKLESDLVKDLYVYNDYAEGSIFVPALNKYCEISIHDVDNVLKYAEDTARKAREYTINDIKDAITCSLWSYRDYLKEYGYDKSLYRKKIPIDVSENNILDYMLFTGVHATDGGIAFWFEVPWEVEHGFSWVFKGKDLIYVGSGQDIFPNDDSSILGSSGNYARKYHKEVILTEEDKKRIEETYKKNQN